VPLSSETLSEQCKYLYSHNLFGIGFNHGIVIQPVWNNYTASIYLFQRESSRQLAIQTFGAQNTCALSKDVDTQNFKDCPSVVRHFLLPLLFFYSETDDTNF
jgi:hypothetical protein